MNYAKLLEISLFFILHIFLEIGKTQDMSSKIWQTLGDALSPSFLGLIHAHNKAGCHSGRGGFCQVLKI